MTDLFCVSGTSPTGVKQTDRPAEAPQDASFFRSNFHAVPARTLKCDKSQFKTVAHV